MEKDRRKVRTSEYESRSHTKMSIHGGLGIQQRQSGNRDSFRLSHKHSEREGAQEATGFSAKKLASKRTAADLVLAKFRSKLATLVGIASLLLCVI